MSMTRAQMDQRMDAHFGYEVQNDIEGVLATLAPGVEHDIAGWPPGRRTDAKGRVPSTRQPLRISPTPS